MSIKGGRIEKKRLRLSRRKTSDRLKSAVFVFLLNFVLHSVMTTVNLRYRIMVVRIIRPNQMLREILDSFYRLSPCLLLILLSAVFVFLLNFVLHLMMMTVNIRYIIMVVRNHQAQPMLNDREK